MPRLLRMPEVAAGATEAVLAEWMVAESAEFAAGGTIATVETDKALVDVEAEDAGVLLKTLATPGAHVEVGAPIAVLGQPGEAIGDLGALLAGAGAGPAAPPPATPVRGRVYASPLARRMAKQSGLDVATITGTGPGGRILRRDVEAASAAPAPARPAAVRPADGEIPHSRARQAIAARLVESKQTAPHFYLRATARAGRLAALRAEINAGPPASRVSVTDLVVKAAAAAHQRVPGMNVIWTPDAVRTFGTVDVAVAVDTDRGLVTPVLRDVTAQTITQVAARTQDLAARARDGRLRQDELEGGTITVTNLGMYGVEEFAAIINPPQAAILAVGAVRDEPVVRRGAVVAGQVMTVTLSVDHRPVDGVTAARWLAALQELLENPVQILV